MFFKRLTKDKRPPAPPAAASRDEASPGSVVPAPLGRSEAQKLSADALRLTVDAQTLGFKTTADLTPADGLIGQERAFEAIAFGLGLQADGFNIFVLGPAASGKSTAVTALLAETAAAWPQPPDWVYVPRFGDGRRPRALALPAGRGPALAEGVRVALDELWAALPTAFQSEDYRARRSVIDEELRAARDDAMANVRAKAAQQNIAILRTPLGFSVAPMHDGKVVRADVFNQLPATMRRDVETRVAALEAELAAVLAHAPQAAKQRRQLLHEINAETARHAVEEALDPLSSAFADCPDVATFLADLEQDLIANADHLAAIGLARPPSAARACGALDGYLVTVVATQSAETAGAPVVPLGAPSVAALTGVVARAEARDQTQAADGPTALAIRPGALHRANGGVLLIKARDLTASPPLWDALKHALKTGEIRMLPGGAEPGTTPSPLAPEPEPIPLSVKVVLLGDGEALHQLDHAAPDFTRLFKVQADFDDTLARSPENDRSYARLIASMTALHGLRPIDAGGVARLIEEAQRLAEARERLTLEIGRIADIALEADHWARASEHATITADDIRRALDQRSRRSERVRTQAHDAIERGVVLVATSGAKIGQVNGLSLASRSSGGGFARPVRVSARVHAGRGGITDIERDSSLGGALHSKGVMILSGYLAGHFAEDAPLALAATLVFEQSYEPVDGDSASAAELFALLSALSGVPVRQDLAVTGSVNQWGEVQAVGGVNEKIEGFFDVCAARGLTGTQGVIIPEANRQHLMVREDVVVAVREGRFNVFAIKTADEGIALLTGLEAGEKGPSGFGAETVNGRVAARLKTFAERTRAGLGANRRDPGSAA